MAKIKDIWEYHGENNPYFAVSTFDKYKTENLNEEIKNEFFETGETHFIKVWNEINKYFINDFRPKRALDFGCGVGRLVIPLSEKCEEIVGVDISEKMIDLAKENCLKMNVTNVSFLQTEDFLQKDIEKFSFIHSFIVMQHIEPTVGDKLLNRMLDLLEDDGIGVLHFTYANISSAFEFFRFRLYRDFPIVNGLKNLVKREKQEPFVPMYLYDINKLLLKFQANNCHRCLLRYTYHGLNGIVFFFQKTKEIIY